MMDLRVLRLVWTERHNRQDVMIMRLEEFMAGVAS